MISKVTISYIILNIYIFYPIYVVYVSYISKTYFEQSINLIFACFILSLNPNPSTTFSRFRVQYKSENQKHTFSSHCFAWKPNHEKRLEASG